MGRRVVHKKSLGRKGNEIGLIEQLGQDQEARYRDHDAAAELQDSKCPVSSAGKSAAVRRTTMMQRLSIVSALIVTLGMVATLSGCSEDEGTTGEGSAAAAQVPESAIVPGDDSLAYATELFAAFDDATQTELPRFHH